jgi:hypothetical protein
MGHTGPEARRPFLPSLVSGVRTSLAASPPLLQPLLSSLLSLLAWRFPRGEEEEEEEGGGRAGRGGRSGGDCSEQSARPRPLRCRSEGSSEPGRVQVCPPTSGGH